MNSFSQAHHPLANKVSFRSAVCSFLLKAALASFSEAPVASYHGSYIEKETLPINSILAVALVSNPRRTNSIIADGA